MIDQDFIEVCMAELGEKSERGVILAGIRLIDGNGNVVSETTNQLKNATTEQFFLGWFYSKVALYLCSTLYNTRRLNETGRVPFENRPFFGCGRDSSTGGNVWAGRCA